LAQASAAAPADAARLRGFFTCDGTPGRTPSSGLQGVAEESLSRHYLARERRLHRRAISRHGVKVSLRHSYPKLIISPETGCVRPCRVLVRATPVLQAIRATTSISGSKPNR